jgi:hypothetical protein
LSAVLGFHIAVFTSYWNGSICPLCVAALTGTIVAVLGLFVARRGKAYLLVIFTCCLSLSSVIVHSTRLLGFDSPQLLKLGKDLNAEKNFDRHFVNIVVFTSDSCSLCKKFRSEYDPELKRDATVPVRIFYRTSKALITFPTVFFVGGEQPAEIGLPPFQKLLAEVNSVPVVK